MKVTFAKAWRGYSAGDTADLTDERADELSKAGYFETEAKPAKKTTKKAVNAKAKTTADDN